MKRTWVFALPVNREIVIYDENVEDYVSKFISEDWAKRLVDNTNVAIKSWESDTPDGLSNYYPPVIKEHKLDGWRGGDIISAKIGGQADRHGVYLQIDWRDKTWEQIESLETQHISIGTTSDYTDSRGRKFDTIIKELSLTEDPRLKDIGTIQDTIRLQLAETLKTKEEVKMTPEEMVEAIAKLLARIEELEKQVGELKGEAVVEEAGAEEVIAEELSEEDEDKIAMELADKLVVRATKLAEAKLLKLRLNDGPAHNSPKKLDPLAKAKAQGLKGRAAVEAALGNK